ncbi:MAG: hypothetical protein L6R42_000445 [Xanthoria sp. 1 TBL-2021]|nr:MAG: hypothetical protein L6R42_000445 [Xanthoria sp. 1 TBL-2021]
MAYTEEELAQYERLSNEYVPDAEGPLVSPRQSSQRITSEYAQADPVYVHKTTTLPQQFSQYRTVKGDGNCGWRALAFGYFEALLQTADPSRVLGEVARLTSLNNVLDSVGYPRDIYEDFTDETLQLLRGTAASLPVHDDGAALLASFNDSGICNAIIMHFRLVTSAWMKTHADSYIHYTENQSIQDYCSSHIEPHAVEIDNLGLQACIDAIIKPAGIAVQVLYLDRSPGEQVNQIDWPAEPSTLNAPYAELSTIRLLYRPGHYDILYKHEDIDMLPAAAVTNPQINLMSGPVYLPSGNMCYSQEGLDLDNFYIPGLASAGVSLALSTNAYMSNAIYAPSALPITSAVTDSYGVPYSEPPKAIVQSPTLEGPWNTDRFRPSQYQVDHKFRQVIPIRAEPCQTEAMKQAGESKAHFRNEDFQPQIWEPGAEYNIGRNSEPNRRRSS